MSNRLNDHSVDCRAIEECNSYSHDTIRKSGNCRSSRIHDAEDDQGGFSSPISYTCSFCKREFRSAQALGGHMNVHRRDRARLRCSPLRHVQDNVPHLDLTPNPYLSILPLASLPNRLPAFTCSSPSLVSSPFSSLSSPASASASHELMNAAQSPTGVEQCSGVKQEDGCKVLKKARYSVSLDLNIGLLSDTEDLDLELRLGFS